MALVIEGIFINKTITSLQIKVHECYIKELSPRETLLTIDESEESEQIKMSDSGESDDNEPVEDLVISDKELED